MGPVVDPIPDHPAAVASVDGERALVIADYHAGIEDALRYERGIELPNGAEKRRERVRSLVERTAPDRLVFLGDLMHSIGGPGGAERGEIEVLLERLPDLPVTLVKGNHDGGVEEWIEGVAVTDARGVRIGNVGFAHGHTWPAPEVLDAAVICVGHEHPCVRLVDEVGGSRVERVWLRGPMDRAVFEGHGGEIDRAAFEGHGGDSRAEKSSETPIADRDRPTRSDPELVVFPAFNERSGGTWVNTDQGFLSPFLPAAFVDGAADAYLLDGTRLGDYRRV